KTKQKVQSRRKHFGRIDPDSSPLRHLTYNKQRNKRGRKTDIKHLRYSKVCAQWVPKMLSDDQKAHRMGSALTFLAHSNADGEGFLKLIVTGDETWIQHVIRK
ncbi:hypothetical protein AMK59_283, partial [Oryctes borbonicus]